MGKKEIKDIQDLLEAAAKNMLVYLPENGDLLSEQAIAARPEMSLEKAQAGVLACILGWALMDSDAVEFLGKAHKMIEFGGL